VGPYLRRVKSEQNSGREGRGERERRDKFFEVRRAELALS